MAQIDLSLHASGMPGQQGYPLTVPKPWLSLLLVGGLASLITLATNDSLLPSGLRDVMYSVMRTNANARQAAIIALGVHVVEGLICLSVCVRRGYGLVPTVYWPVLNFIVGYPILQHVLDLTTKGSKTL